MSRSKQKFEYKRVAQRVAEGKTDTLVDPFDYMILAMLPAQGGLIGGVIPLAETARQIARQFGTDQVDTTMIGGRLTAMKAAGLTHVVSLPREATHGWQITPQGEKVLKRWQESQSTNGKEAS